MDYEDDRVVEPKQEELKTSNESYPEQEEETAELELPESEQEVDSATKKPRAKRWEKERRAREEKYLLSQELAEEKRRNLELRDYLSRSVDNNTMNTADKAVRQLDIAERAHADALESGDALAAAKASTALIQANLAVERAANAKIYTDENAERENINPTAYAATRLLNDWLGDNPEFDENSNYFSEELVTKIAPLIDNLDSKLKKRGQVHLISSPMYFDVIDTMVSQVKSGKKYDRPMTAPVNSRTQRSQFNPRSKPVLTDQQRMVAAGCNMSEEQYANWLKKYEKQKVEQENSRSPYGY